MCVWPTLQVMIHIDKETTIEGVPYIRKSWAQSKIDMLENEVGRLAKENRELRACMGQDVVTCLAMACEHQNPFDAVSQGDIEGFAVVAHNEHDVDRETPLKTEAKYRYGEPRSAGAGSV